MRGRMTDQIYGIAEGEVGPSSGHIIAECWSVMCPRGESGTVDTSGIEVVDEDEFRSAVTAFIKARLSESFWANEIETLEETITGKPMGAVTVELAFMQKAVPLTERAASLGLSVFFTFADYAQCISVEMQSGTVNIIFESCYPEMASKELDALEESLQRLERTAGTQQPAQPAISGRVLRFFQRTAALAHRALLLEFPTKLSLSARCGCNLKVELPSHTVTVYDDSDDAEAILGQLARQLTKAEESLGDT